VIGLFVGLTVGDCVGTASAGLVGVCCHWLVENGVLAGGSGLL